MMAVPVGKTIISKLCWPISFRSYCRAPGQTAGTIKFENPTIGQSESKPPITNNVNTNDPGLSLRAISLEPKPLPEQPPSKVQQPSLQESHLFGLGLPLDITASTSSAYTDVEKSIRWGHDGRGSIVGYDIFQELEERLQEVLSRNDAGPNVAIKIQDKGNELEPPLGKEKDIKKVNKVNAALESINRFLSFYLFRSTLYPKRW